ncbi:MULTISPECIES: bifunctional metallophosphatase/5'-nucleotidase [Aneurinibacillus]|uniref:2',3'-cyclic-nucleotide 2'-phosphodiesterase/5'-or 3'-nucleotidase, 5'-nucleotidase family n=1 Tax=Aneurinibacillus thermoaerophilus TaxID=143495 RepID=A0A1G8C081_ANETH|nr:MULTISPECIES: bifunctional UDP-sugar hydrolase/5'-nucleotidase [Aneurinibacillus]AMA71956.1 hypothetical protein ACH33_03275 [Aneurinibacillus sp. XH2]MED0677603.1 bifunctional UDP-sugar hydrolase/5'-nucleotidase [Aneurinibacillus thermoaerophilus]MED0737118.1 bifunctional UDP-sugar hydrolase/5'-nucleotidase [Aneurinibacillus thermoaerophilus]MED0757164.1 bifunctional UDP-sugar hydrolase/5'-nucleotidase [Aneurinibacillus thermoaerophilus]MED0762512.1 bifunctional UDP-sugar hydrolase/5'-nucl
MGLNKKNTLHILHTNDLHSHFEEMARIATGLKQLRLELQKQGYPVVTVDLGDHMDRMRLQTEATWGQVNVDVLNETRYDFVTIGNNEGLTFPRPKFNELYRNAAFSVICANLLDAKTKQPPPFLRSYTITKYGDFTVGWIGVTASFPEVYKLLGFITLDPTRVVAEQVASIRPYVDIIIVLSHVGYQWDVEMARNIDGIDVILGAHTHTYLAEGERINHTLVCQTGKFGQNIGHVTITYDKLKKTICKLEARCLPTHLYKPDGKVERIVDRHRRHAEQVMGEVVARLEYDLPVSWEEESPLGNLLAAGLRSWVDAEIGIVNSGTLLFSLEKGNITRKDILSLCPHPINPCRMKLTGEQLLDILEESLNEEIIKKQIQGFGFRGKVLGCLCVDGADIYYNPLAPVGRRIVRVEVQGRPLRKKQLYSVGTIDMFTFGIVFPTFQKGLGTKFYLPEFLRDVLEKQLRTKEALEKSLNRHWYAE